MNDGNLNRRDFMKTGAMAAVGGAAMNYGSESSTGSELQSSPSSDCPMKEGGYGRHFNDAYSGPFLDRIAFPLGGLGAGMVCVEGSGCISHVSVRNKPDVFNEPFMMGAISIKGDPSRARVLEGPVPRYKVFGRPLTGNGSGASTYGFPRFENATFTARFPFARIALQDRDMPVEVKINAWSPFVPGDEDASSLPVACLEYEFTNTTSRPIEAVFSYHAMNFMGLWKQEGNSIKSMKNGFVLSQECQPKNPHFKGEFGIFTDTDEVVVDHCMFRGGWFDGRTILWKYVTEGAMPGNEVKEGASGASLYVPIQLNPGESKVIPLFFAWYVPYSDVRQGPDEAGFAEAKHACESGDSDCCSPDYTEFFYQPWYAEHFEDCREVASYWSSHYSSLRSRSDRFSEAFYSQTLPPEVLEAVAANLSILKSPTVLRQGDGKLWAWEGCGDEAGCCHGSCTHVWNYAQAIAHLFPRLERSLRETEFQQCQDETGHQNFRASIPIREVSHNFHAAADGELGCIMKMHRDWRISGDTQWLKALWPRVRQSMEYCIRTWDPKGKGVLEEPHHNTYDIEFWGPDGMCTSFYLGALYAITRMGEALGEDVSGYRGLYEKGKQSLEGELYNGEYFIQKIQWEGLVTPSPLEKMEEAWNVNYSEEAKELLRKEGPKYQYGTGCLSDGILGAWIGKVCGLGDFVDSAKVRSHLEAVHRYNLKKDLSDHVNPQRPSYALGEEGGLLLCTWPRGGALTLPFVYSNEVWTGIEYQVASHLMFMGEVEAGLDIVKEVRKRYDGRIRNPFNEYECGHWYARALASYGLIEGLTGVRYDAVDQTLHIDSQVGDSFSCLLSTENGYALTGLHQGVPYLNILEGDISISRCVISGVEVDVPTPTRA